MADDSVLVDLTNTIVTAGWNSKEFLVALSQREPGWVVVRNATVTRHYPLGREATILLSAELRHGVFGKRASTERVVALAS